MSYGPEIKIDLPVKKYAFLKIQTCLKLIERKVLCFSHSIVSKLDSINFRMVSINSRTASNILQLDSSLDSQSFQESRIENWVSSIKLWEAVNLHLSGTVHCLSKSTSTLEKGAARLTLNSSKLAVACWLNAVLSIFLHVTQCDNISFTGCLLFRTQNLLHSSLRPLFTPQLWTFL